MVDTYVIYICRTCGKDGPCTLSGFFSDINRVPPHCPQDGETDANWKLLEAKDV